MNYDQLTGIVRTVVPSIVAYAVGKGWIPEGAAADVAAAVICVIMAGWSLANNKTGKTIQPGIISK